LTVQREGLIDGDTVSFLLGHWKPEELAFIETLVISQDEMSGLTNLSLIGLFQPRPAKGGSWPNHTEKTTRIRIEFTGVQSLKLVDFGGGIKPLTGFQIVDVACRGLEGISYEVGDYEAGQIAFYCMGWTASEGNSGDLR